MERIATANTGILNPGSRSVFQDLIPGTQNGTDLGATWHTAVQEEIMAIIEGNGLPAEATLAQMLQGVTRMTASGYADLSASTALTYDQSAVAVTAAAGNVVLTLPPAGIAGSVGGVATVLPAHFRISRSDATLNTVSLVCSGSDGIWVAGSFVTTMQIPPAASVRLFSGPQGTWNAAFSRNGYRWEPTVLGATPSGGTVTVPAGCTLVRALVWGAGGCGGGSSALGAPGGGGGGGGYAESLVAVTPLAAIPVTVGVGNATGAAGGSSSFGTFVAATGGSAGTGGASGAPGTGGAGGTGTAGTILIPGAAGTDGIVYSYSSSSVEGGQGGWGYALPSLARAAGGSGAAITPAPGGLAGGSSGGNGALAASGNGLVILEWL